MKILHVIANLAPRYGGPSKACIEMARAVAKQGHDVTIATTNQDGTGVLDVPLNQPILKDGVTIYYFPIQFPRFLGASWPLANFLKHQIKQFDVVHIHSLYLFHNAIAEYYCHRYHIPYLIRPHGTLDPYIYHRHRLRKRIMEMLFQNRYLNLASGIHFTTEEEEALAAPYTFQRPAFIIPNGINLEDYQALPSAGTFKKQFPQFQSKRIVLFLGRINFKKGLDLLIPAFAKLTKQLPDIHLILAGPDNDGYLKEVNQWIAEQNISEHVSYVGMLLGEQKLAAFRDAELFVLPSYSENFGISVLEAMACHIPVIISNKVNLWSEVQTHQAGLITTCDVDDLSNNMKQLLASSELRNKVSKHAYELVKEKYSWSPVAHQLIHAYQDIRI